jgi:heterodisulfide reductase subunit A
MAASQDVLVIGAGLAGIEASLVLASAGRKVYLVEHRAHFGGSVVRSEEVFPELECATCMIAPKQSDLMAHPNIVLMTLTELVGLEGEAGGFRARLVRRARFVSLENCIGCNACFEPCPVSVPNEFEEGLSERKAISLPAAGMLPNAPAIDMGCCLRAKGEECTACRDACMFEAIVFEDKDETVELDVGAVVVATGYRLGDGREFADFGMGRVGNVFGAFEFERLRASNGPTGGEILTREGEKPKKIGLIHCVGRDEKGYCSQVCCRYLAKFARYAFDKLPGAEVLEFVREISVPGKQSEKFFEATRSAGASIIRASGLRVEGNDDHGVRIRYVEGGSEKSAEFDMAVLAPPMVPAEGTAELAGLLGIETDEFGFFRTEGAEPAAATRPGVFVAGCGEGPKDMQSVVVQAQAAASGVLMMESGQDG